MVGTPKSPLKACEQKPIEGGWQNVSDRVQVQLLPEADEAYVLCRSAGRVQKERAMRRRWLRQLIGELWSLRRRVREGQLKQREADPAVHRAIAGTPSPGVALVAVGIDGNPGRPALHLGPGEISKERAGRRRESPARPLDRGRPPAKLWQTQVQLTEAAAAFRTLKSEVKVPPIWHWTEKRVEAHVLVAFLGCSAWGVCLKKKAERRAPSLTPWQILDQLGRSALVEVWFELRDGRRRCLCRASRSPNRRKPCCRPNSTGVCRNNPRRGWMRKICRPRTRRWRCDRRRPDMVWPTWGRCAA